MDSNVETAERKSIVGRAKSCNGCQQIKVKSESAKRKSLNANEAVKSLDSALWRLKRSKQASEAGSSRCAASRAGARRCCADMFMDSTMSQISSYPQSTDNASLMSMNFSHYELMRNVSCSNCNSDGAFSGTTCDARFSPEDTTVKDEHLERYFRSVDMWRNKGELSNFEFTEK